MPTQAYIAITGEKQGNITAGCNTEDSMGNKYQQDHSDESTVIGFNSKVKLPRAPQTGQQTGQRVHHPIVVTKRFDKASPLLYQALCTGERLSEVELKFYRTSMTGEMEHYFTYKLTDALLVDVDGLMEMTTDVSLEHRDHEETWHMTYRKIEWTHEIAGTSGSDDWRAPV